MKFSTLLLTLGATSAAAVNLGFSVGVSQNVLGGGDIAPAENEVPGENPLEFCESTDDYILEIKNVDLEPNPPQAGSKLAIKASGEAHQQIGDGAYVFIEVKYGLIKILTLREDLCAQLRNVDKECPLNEGEQTLIKEVELPSRIPPGTYTVKADVYTKDDKKVTCLQAKVQFG